MTAARTATARAIPIEIVSLIFAIAVVLFRHFRSANFSFSWYWHFVNTSIKMTGVGSGKVTRLDCGQRHLAFEPSGKRNMRARRKTGFEVEHLEHP
jgi:hypothetical protein